MSAGPPCLEPLERGRVREYESVYVGKANWVWEQLGTAK